MAMQLSSAHEDQSPELAGVPEYNASQMTVLEGLEPVRKRPGMYIGSTGISGLHHLVWEVVDNSVDEAMAGYCSQIDVTLLADGGCRVVDNGRGIPTDINPQLQLSGVEIALTKLHGGGKFGGSGYKVSGGLHGVGVSVVNALSRKLEVDVDRDGLRYHLAFRNGGRPQGKLAVTGPAPGGRRGTTVAFWPDPKVFEEIEFRATTILERIQIYAFLNAGLEIRFVDERPGGEQQVFRYDGGIIDYVHHLNASKDALFKKVGYFNASGEEGEVEIAFQWNNGFNADGVHGYANGIATIEGGMHIEGFRTALTAVINKYAKAKNLLKDKDPVLQGEDIREGLTAIVSVKLRDPQFEGQTKAKLGNTSIRSLVQRATNEKLAEWLEERPGEGKQIVAKALLAARAREAARSARDATRRKSALEGAGMPEKLRDCARGTGPEDAELFIVEGDSAAGTAMDGRNPTTQALLPIRGKILNVERARIDRMLKNTEVQALITAIGAGLGEEFDVTKARYHKVCIMADADVDGSHIRTLLLTFFFRQMRPLVEAGYVYICQPPLYSTVVGKEKQYLKDDAEKNAFLAAHPNHKKDFQRLKGLGEMDFDDLKRTTMDPATRALLQVTVEQAALADDVMSRLMGDDVEARKHFIQTNAGELDPRFLDI
jgi:DNA gyrase subunit B